MRKIIVVAVREYQAAVKTKAFIISLVLMPVMMGGVVAFQVFMKDRVDTADKRIAIVDYTDRIFDAIEEEARNRNATKIFRGEGADRKKVKPKFVVERVEPASDNPDQVKLKLSDRVREGEIFAFMVIPAEVIEPGEESPIIKYHSNSPMYDDLRRWASRTVNDQIRTLRFAATDLDQEVVEKVMASTSVDSFELTSLDESGQIVEGKKTNRAANVMIPMALMMLMFMVVMVGATPLIQSVLEEKMQRIAEVLLGSIPPFQLLLGKLIGTVGVSLTLATIYLVGAFVGANRTGFGALFPTHLIIWFVVFQTLAVLMFGSLFIAIGAAVTDMKEAQNLTTPVMLLVMFPMFVWFKVIEEPTAPLSVILSLIPPATPMLMILRQAVPPGVPIWQPLLGIVLVLLTTLVFVFAAGRIFRVGILMQGKGANVAELFRWVFRG